MFNIFKRSNIVKGPRNEDLPLTHEGLPDSYRPNGLCPRCGKQSSFEKIGELPVTFTGGTVYMPDGKKYLFLASIIPSGAELNFPSTPAPLLGFHG